MSPTQLRIRRRWDRALNPRMPKLDMTLAGGGTSELAQSVGTYTDSDVTTTSADFLGDWRSLNSWQRFDALRVVQRSRQLERSNPICKAFKRNVLNNVLGYKGFRLDVNPITSIAAGDATNGARDEAASQLLEANYDRQGRPEFFTTRKRLSRRDVDRLLLSRLMFDGEFILQKRRGFANDYNFAWQLINPDYLDRNLNRMEKNGNMIRQGIEFDATDKFPVAYHFLKRRLSDWQYNWQDQYWSQRYFKVRAEEVIHVFLQTEDEEQERGWPWIFSAMVHLFRSGKYEEAALINAAIGASRGVYFEKTLPEGFAGDPNELYKDGTIVQDLPQGSGLELPVGVTAKVVDMKYPDEQFEAFRNAMMLTVASSFGTSYATTTGDLSKANFVSSRLGQIEEREEYMAIQEFFIEKWKVPGFDEELYRSMLSRQANLPLGKFDKFNSPMFTGRRWPFVQPVDDWKAKEMAMDNCATSVSAVIRETTQRDPEDVFKEIAADKKLMAKYGIERITGSKSETIDDAPPVPGTGNDPNAPDNADNPSNPDDAPTKD